MNSAARFLGTRIAVLAVGLLFCAVAVSADQSADDTAIRPNPPEVKDIN